MLNKLFRKVQNQIKFKKDIKNFIELGGKIDEMYPVLSDWKSTAGNTNNHYFHQDLLVAKYIFSRNPKRHIDIGSRIDGFVAHLSSFREVEILDIRPLELNPIYGIKFLQADLMNDSSNISIKSDSVSCLHALEHFGLGRYGDPLCPDGHILGFRKIWGMVEPGGTLYISFPISSVPRVCFNAHRIFAPNDIFQWFESGDQYELISFDYVGDDGNVYLSSQPELEFNNLRYGCGIYRLKKM